MILTLDRSEVSSTPLGSPITLRPCIPFPLETINVLPGTVCIFEVSLLHIGKKKKDIWSIGNLTDIVLLISFHPDVVRW